MKNTSTPNPKLSVKQLVEIGDAIHDSVCSFILVTNETDQEGISKVMVCNHGNVSRIKKMVFEAIKSSPLIKDIIVDALIMAEMDKIKDKVISEDKE